MLSGLLIQGLNWIGIVVFALSGAITAVERRLDIFGALVLAFVTAVAGGIVRDVLIGAVPPESIVSWHPLAISTVARIRSASLGVWPVVGSCVMSLTVKMPNCICGLFSFTVSFAFRMPRHPIHANECIW